MTPADAGKLLALCATYDNRKPDPTGMAAMSWADALQGLAFDDCAQAIRQHYRTTDRYVMPAHIRTLAVEIANSRHELEQRQQRRAIEAQADPAGAERVRKVLEEFAAQRKIPDARNPHPKQQTELQRRARTVACTWCQASAGQPCTNLGTQKPAAFVHQARLDTAAQPA